MLLAGFVVTFVLWRGLQAPLANPMLERENYRGEAIPTALGFVGVLGFVAVTAAAGVLESLGWVEQPVATSSRNFVLPVVLGFALLGLFDDLAGSGHHRGFGGHAAELGRGRVTTGMLKLLGGALVALAGVAMLQPAAPHGLAAASTPPSSPSPPTWPTSSTGLPGARPRWPSSPSPSWASAPAAWTLLAGPALLLGAALALLIPELAERGMVGDTGANALGAALGHGRRAHVLGGVAGGRARRAGRGERGQRVGVVQLGDRRGPPAALARPLGQPPPCHGEHEAEPARAGRDHDARNSAIGLVPSAGTARRRRSLTRGEAHLRDRRRCQLPRQGAHRLLARAAPEAPGAAGHDAEARPVHQRRPGHDEPLRARRGLRDRRRRRDRPRPRPLRAVHRREPLPGLERHDGLDLPVGAGRRAAGRLPRTHRAGHPPHHRRDQAAGPPPRPPRTSTSSSPRSVAPSATSRSCRSSRRCGSSARTSVARTSATSTSPSCRSSAPRASRRPSRRSTRSPSCAAGASSPT